MQRVYLPKFCINIVFWNSFNTQDLETIVIPNFRGGGRGGVDNKGNEKMVVTAPFLSREDTTIEVKFCQESFLCPFGRYIIHWSEYYGRNLLSIGGRYSQTFIMHQAKGTKRNNNYINFLLQGKKL